MADRIVSDGFLDIERLVFDAESAIAFANVSGYQYEIGTYTVEEEKSFPNIVINFKNPHDKAPIIAAFVDVTGTYDSTLSTLYSDVFWNFNALFDSVIYYDSENTAIALQHQISRSNSESQLVGNSTTHRNQAMVNAVVTNTSYKPGLSTRYIRPGRTYKWVAVWM